MCSFYYCCKQNTCPKQLKGRRLYLTHSLMVHSPSWRWGKEREGARWQKRDTSHPQSGSRERWLRALSSLLLVIQARTAGWGGGSFLLSSTSLGTFMEIFFRSLEVTKLEWLWSHSTGATVVLLSLRFFYLSVSNLYNPPLPFLSISRIPGCPGTHDIIKGDLELPILHSAGNDRRVCHHTQLYKVLEKEVHAW